LSEDNSTLAISDKQLLLPAALFQLLPNKNCLHSIQASVNILPTRLANRPALRAHRGTGGKIEIGKEGRFSHDG
jgi:hypothetical protein